MIRARTALLAIACVLPALAGCGPFGGDDDGSAEQVGTPIEAPGVGELALLGPGTEEAGDLPTLEWEPVDGAAAYRLVVLDSRQDPIWAWEGKETSIVLGAIPDRPKAAGGARIERGSSWSVSAFDRRGAPIAVSVSRPVSP